MRVVLGCVGAGWTGSSGSFSSSCVGNGELGVGTFVVGDARRETGGAAVDVEDSRRFGASEEGLASGFRRLRVGAGGRLWFGGGGRCLGFSPGGGTGPFIPVITPPLAGPFVPPPLTATLEGPFTLPPLAAALTGVPVPFSSAVSVSVDLPSSLSALVALTMAFAVPLCSDRVGLRRNPPLDLRGITYKCED